MSEGTSAHTVATTRIVAATTTVGWRSARERLRHRDDVLTPSPTSRTGAFATSASTQSDARINNRIQHVREQIYRHDQYSENENQRLDDRIVLAINAIHQ